MFKDNRLLSTLVMMHCSSCAAVICSQSLSDLLMLFLRLMAVSEATMRDSGDLT